MTHYACIAHGMADYMPNDQSYIQADTAEELARLVADACRAWEDGLPEPDETQGDEFYSYAFRHPREGENNYSQRLRIHASTDWVLDVIGMTADEYEREAGGED